MWGVTDIAARSLGHEPSSALSRLATKGYRSELYKLVQKQTPEENNTLSMKLTREAIKMAEDQMIWSQKNRRHQWNCVNSGGAFAMAAAQMGVRYYVITGLSNNNHAFGNSDIYE